ncbi:Glutamate-rich WD repeat-containing protein 1 [Toxocara canis]|uniref:Glutamate-rich WD repeat-containing protein 1 n=1 Tax=Toxocara canis TaxID=6265 RepID=A0A0B2VJM6_TOXCA|nr:Glutamate-rich WD repeat-containing protein 1 [Toxocara canis]
MDDEKDDVEDAGLMEEGEDATNKDSAKRVYIPGVSRPLKEDEEWEFDPEAYRQFHSFETKWPCLSFDTIIDDLGENRSEFPMTCSLVAGTEAERARDNELIIMRLSNLTAIESEKEEDSASEDEDEAKEDSKTPRLHAAIIPHQGGVNRIRVAKLGDSRVCAVWNDLAKVQLWNLNGALKEINEMEGGSRSVKIRERPLFSFVGHRAEGYALAWSPVELGSLASGDNSRNIHIWRMGEGGQWAVDQRPLTGHTGPVEDIAWSPNEQSLLVSCSGDGSIKLWDTRSAPADACVCTVPNAHEADVNVLSWNKQEPLLVTGGDDAALRVWTLKTIQRQVAGCFLKGEGKIGVTNGPVHNVYYDLFGRSAPADACVCTVPNAHEADVNVLSWNKQEPLLVTGGDDAALRVWTLKTIQYGQPVARFKHHKGPITSVEWCPHESTTMMASGEDDQITIWDLAVEAEPTEETVDVPPQLLFVHMGQKEVKEVHWHSQIHGLAITTALSGFNVFRTISV